MDMFSFKEIFCFSKAETIAISLLLAICLIGGSILIYEHSRETVPPELIFQTLQAGTLPAESADDALESAPSSPVNEAPNEKLESNLASTSHSSQLLININTAPAESLSLLPFVGPALSSRIIDYREKNGSFQSVEQLVAVYGIGPKTLERIRPFIICQ